MALGQRLTALGTVEERPAARPVGVYTSGFEDGPVDVEESHCVSDRPSKRDVREIGIGAVEVVPRAVLAEECPMSRRVRVLETTTGQAVEVLVKRVLPKCIEDDDHYVRVLGRHPSVSCWRSYR
ncbi:hypothetical protein [Halarchaeum salinum]|uniref:Uncharacterized protein n=1 Tax=Halarchaeum salinum TaxID=489912 RepID=A0AAV3S537_9EURY